MPTASYTFTDKGTNASDVEDNFGIITAGATLKPAYTSIKSALGC